MMSPRRFLPILAFLALLLGGAPPAAALEHGPYALDVLVDGRPLRELASGGATYVEALAGREYSIRLRNLTSRRIAVALAVDGLNTIDARTTTAAEAAKWILGPYETVTIDGWQTGTGTARHFFFTTEEQSYGAWLGRTRNLGVISAAVFREKRPEPAPIQRPLGESAPSRLERKAAGDASGPSAEQRALEPSPMLSDDLAATGIGRELDHRVRRVPFDAESHPAAVLEMRYEYHEALVRLGVLPAPWGLEPLERRERAHGFEGMEFAPDPYRR